ncbi:MAG: hypothetical protein ACOYI4_00985 [Christensenellales bacterium]|jgi:hypothetical protein
MKINKITNEKLSEKELFIAALSNWHCDLDGTTDLGTMDDWEIDYSSIDYDNELIYATALCKIDGRTYTLYEENGDIMVIP